MTREEEPLAREADVDLLNWRGVPVKAVAVAMRAARRRVIADFMFAFCGGEGELVRCEVQGLVGEKVGTHSNRFVHHNPT